MCYHPLNIRVKSKYFSPSYSTLVHADVPCGNCIECCHKKRDEIHFRCIYEAKRCIDNGGFVLSQALTYRESDVPRMKDFLEVPDCVDKSFFDNYCFCRAHIRFFFMRLRNHLTRDLGLDVAYNLKYLLAAEYGTSETGTHRPHYHVLFFCTIPNLTWEMLSTAIEYCWQYGLSDGIISKGRNYMLNELKPHVFTQNMFDDVKSIEKCISYVSEYLVKDSVFVDTLRCRLDYFSDVVKKQGLDPKPLIKLFKRNCNQFRLNSHHFGDNFLDYNSYDEICRTGMIRVKHSSPDMPFLYIKLPLYFERKLFYTLRRDFDNTLKWCLNEQGELYKQKRVLSFMHTFKRRFEDIYNFAPVDFKCRVDALLDKRNFDQFTEYVFLYKGRFVTDIRYNAQQQLDNICHTLFYKDKSRFLQPEVYAESCYNYYSQDTDFEFRYFDELFALFSEQIMSTNSEKENTEIFKQQILKRKRYEQKNSTFA